MTRAVSTSNPPSAVRMAAVALVVLFGALCAAVPAAAQEDAPAGTPERYHPGGGPRRVLAGHRFIPSLTVADPFVATYVYATTGFGQALGLEVPVYDNNGETVQIVTADQLFILQEFGYAQRFTDWLSARFSMSALGRIGSGFDALLAEGVSGIVTMDFEGKARVFGGERAQVSVTLAYRKNDLTLVTPLEWVRAIIDGINNGNLRENSTKLVNDVSGYRFSAGGRCVYAIDSWVGAQASIDVGLSNARSTPDGGRIYVSAGAAVDVDLGDLTPVDLGLIYSGHFQSSSDRSEENTKDSYTSSIGFAYTGATDFNIGLYFSQMALKQRTTGGRFDGAALQLSLRYDF